MKTVLIVDDERLIRWSLTQELRDRFTVYTAASVEEAHDILNRVHVDAVVTDLKMPDEDGIRLVEEIRAKRPDVAILVISAYCVPTIRRHLDELGVIASLSKPFKIAEVRALLERALGEVRSTG
jgi:DNA-binding NtrC family response regulator